MVVRGQRTAAGPQPAAEAQAKAPREAAKPSQPKKVPSLPPTAHVVKADKSLHQCTVCSRRFHLRYAFQVVAMSKQRHVVCSEKCRTELLAPLRAASDRERRAPARALAVVNQKGGTGKTTTSVSLAAGLAERGNSVLLMDLDAQGNVGVSLGIRSVKTLYHLLVEGVSTDDAAVPVRKGLDVITSDHTLAAAELELVSMPDRARVLSRRLAPLLAGESRYDYVVLDCPPSLSLLNQNALTFAREVVIPVSCDYLALVGVKQILKTLRHVNEVLLHPIEVLGVLPTFYDVRNKISKESIESLRSHFKAKAMPPIRINAKLKEAPSHKKTIYEYAPSSHGAEDYTAAVEWVLKRHAEKPMPAVVAAAPRRAASGGGAS